MTKDIDQAIRAIQKTIRMLAIKGNAKNTRYLKTALAALQTYKRLAKETEGDKGRID